MTRTRRALALATLFAALGCPGDPVGWTTPTSGLDRIVLSVWGDTPSNLYFAGGSLGGTQPGLAMHFDGRRWTELAPPTTGTLWWVFSRGPGKPVWFVGEQGTILRWGGSSFTATPSGTTQTLYGVWGGADDDLWAVGGMPDRSSVALHWDGQTWSPAVGLAPGPGAFFKVWGTSPSDVFLVGQYATLMHFDGLTWSAMPTNGAVGQLTSLLTVAGRAPDDVYAVGGVGAGVAIHYDGKKWSPVAGLTASDTPGLTGVAVSPAGDVSITGLAGTKLRGRDGATWVDESKIAPRLDLHATWIFGPEDIFAVGGNLNAPPGSPRDGVVAHYGHSLPRR